MKPISRSLRFPAMLALAAACVAAGGAGVLSGACGPFTDTAADSFCPAVLEIFTLGITTGTTPTTFAPADNVTRLQMATFLSRTVDTALKRGSRRAIAAQFWETRNPVILGLTTVGQLPKLIKSDGTDVWVPNQISSTISRVHGSDGKLLETWTGATFAVDLVTAMGAVIAVGLSNPGRLYRLDPGQAAGAVTTVASNLGVFSGGVAFDGYRVWTANQGASVSIVTPGASVPWTVTTVTAAAFNTPTGILYDGGNIWITDIFNNRIFKLDDSGAILQTVTVGVNPIFPTFDGTNIWVPNEGGSVSVVRASTGAVLATLTGNGLLGPLGSAFDGQRVLVTNFSGNSVSLWRAADLSPLGSFATGASTNPIGACSDGLSFWITLQGVNLLGKL